MLVFRNSWYLIYRQSKTLIEIHAGPFKSKKDGLELHGKFYHLGGYELVRGYRLVHRKLKDARKVENVGSSSDGK